MLLSVEDLRIAFAGAAQPVRLVDGASFSLAPGRTLALVGESGCGKSLTALAIVGLLPPGLHASGRVIFDGRDLLSLPETAMRRYRGRRIAMIFQEPMSALNPLMTIGEQIGEVLRTHRGLRGRAERECTIELLTRVGILQAADRLRAYPHEFSGGMRQRVMIAAALAGEPDLLIADEPTTALDVTVQAQIVGLLQELQRATGMAILFVTHDFGLVAALADEVCVMYTGRIVERGRSAAMLVSPRHPYTRGLLACVPRLAVRHESAVRVIPVIPGEAPSAAARPPGCPFHPRCEAGRDDPQCRTTPPTWTEAGELGCACWKA